MWVYKVVIIASDEYLHKSFDAAVVLASIDSRKHRIAKTTDSIKPTFLVSFAD